MVKRYPHTAIISGETEGHNIKGEYIPGEPFNIQVQGCYFPSNSGQQVKSNVDGKECIVKGEFSTKHEPVNDVTRIQIDEKNLDAPIICWEKFQTHSVIYV